MSTPPATTATVPTASAASWALASMLARHSRYHHQPGETQFARQRVGEFAGKRTGVARAHNGDHLLLQQMGMSQQAMMGGGASSAARPRG